MIDVDGSGNITLEELKNGLERVGADLKDSEITNLMQAVSANCWAFTSDHYCKTTVPHISAI